MYNESFREVQRTGTRHSKYEICQCERCQQTGIRSRKKKTCSLSKLTGIVIHFEMTHKSRDFSNISFCRHHLVLGVATFDSHSCASFRRIVLLLKWLHNNRHSVKFNNTHQHITLMSTICSLSSCVCSSPWNVDINSILFNCVFQSKSSINFSTFKFNSIENCLSQVEYQQTNRVIILNSKLEAQLSLQKARPHQSVQPTNKPQKLLRYVITSVVNSENCF